MGEVVGINTSGKLEGETHSYKNNLVNLRITTICIFYVHIITGTIHRFIRIFVVFGFGEFRSNRQEAKNVLNKYQTPYRRRGFVIEK